MRRRQFITLLGGAAAAGPLTAHAQQAGKIPRIGFMGNSTPAMEANLVGPFREGLRELGYEEGHNLIIEFRWAEGKYDRFPALVIAVGDPIGTGVVPSLARPGSNITGLSSIAPDANDWGYCGRSYPNSRT